MNIKFFYFQSNKEDWCTLAQSVYKKKITPFYPFEFKIIKSVNLKRSQRLEKVKKEETLLLKNLNKDDYLVLFDENGKKYGTSEQFAEGVQRVIELNKKSIVFLIGGSFGVSELVKERANLKINLSTLTMNHHVALVVALEQIYRSLCIMKNIPYHNR